MLTNNKYKSFYRSLANDFDKDFMIPCYSESVSLKRGSGYFSLHSLIMSIDGIIRFIHNRGEIRLICNPELSENDIALIEAGTNLDANHVTKDLLEAIQGTTLSDDEANKLDIICNMLSCGQLTIKIAFMPDGIYHEKIGIFTDEEANKVYFNGSANETVSAKVRNFESFTVLNSWNGAEETISEVEDYFDLLWNDNMDGISVLAFPEVVKNKLFEQYKRSATLEKAITNYISSKVGIKKKELHKYQENAIQEFCDNDYVHFYEMATGTGKTFTSIRTIARLNKEISRPLFTVVCVPQVDLQVQWHEAIADDQDFELYDLGGIKSGIDTTAELENAIIAYFTEDKSVVCIAVYDTFFSKIYQQLTSIRDLFVIVDEAHNLTPGQLACFPKNTKYKLGLSATIQRYSEQETKQIIDYFTKPNVKPFYYGLDDAIRNGFLSHYMYLPLYVHLTEDEFSRYAKKTIALATEMAKEHPDAEEINKMSRERSLIVKQAENKLSQLADMTEQYEFDNSVVYCGMGKDGEEPIINKVTKILHNAGIKVSTFTSQTINRPQVLYEFENGYFQTLVAIKCFDEGVDVPKLDKIYIMASDASMRQTVQRRGRVLRKCKETNKQMAFIYDMIALPPDTITEGAGVKSLLAAEFARAFEYNSLAENKDANESSLNNLISYYNINQEDVDNERESD